MPFDFNNLGTNPQNTETNQKKKKGFNFNSLQDTPINEEENKSSLLGEFVSPAVKVGLSVAELMRPSNLAALTKGPLNYQAPEPKDWKVNVFGKETTSVQNRDKIITAMLNSGEITKEQAMGMYGEDLLDVASTLPIGKAASLVKGGVKTLGKEATTQTLKGLIKEGAKTGSKYGLAYGAGYGVTGAMQENKSTEEVLKSGAKGGAMGGVVGGALGGAIPVGVVGAQKVVQGSKNMVGKINKIGSVENIIKKREKELSIIEGGYTQLRKAQKFSKDNLNASRNRVASTDVLVDAVDETGTIRTTTKGGAVEQYKAQTVDGLENVVKKNLEQRGERVSLDVVKKELVDAVDNSGLEGGDLVNAKNKIGKEIEGYALKADAEGYIPLTLVHDAKVSMYENINFMTEPQKAAYRKAIARGLKKTIEDNSQFNVKEVNEELGKYLQDIKYLEMLDGKKVKGGKLGKYFSQITGNIAGAAVGGMVGGPAGSAVGTIVGGEIGSRLRGSILSKTLAGKTGQIAKKSTILSKAKEGINIGTAVKETLQEGMSKIKPGLTIEDVSKKGEGAIPKITKPSKEFNNYFKDWGYDNSKKEVIPEKVIQEAAQYKPKKSVTLYRGIEKGQVDGNGPTSWTYNKDIAKEHTYGDGKVISRKVNPDEILLDSTELPSELQQKYNFFDEEMEVILKPKPKKTSTILSKPATPLPEGGKIATLYRGEGYGSKKGGKWFARDKDFVEKFFAGKGERVQANILESDIYKPDKLPKSNDKNAINKAIKEAKEKGFSAIEIDEGKGFLGSNKNYKSVFVIDKSKLSQPQGKPLQEGGVKVKPKTEVKPYIEKGNLTTNTLQKLEGKLKVSRQFISDLTNQPDLKQTERELIRDVLSRQKGDKIDVKNFAKDVKIELLPLKRKDLNKTKEFGKTPRYENISLPDEVRGNVADYSEHIYESPIKTSAGQTHFGNSSENYFGHTRIEDMVTDTKPVINGKRGLKRGSRYEKSDTRRVIEVQSDLYQKGNLENEFLRARDRLSYDDIKRDKVRYKNANDDFRKLQQYNNPTAHFRMVREEVAQAVKNGKTKLQFPTGETAMKIEGLGGEIDTIWKNAKGERISITTKLNTGENIKDVAGVDWIITDVLGDGKFKAIPKDAMLKFTGLDGKVTTDLRRVENIPDSAKETFDISGKVDTNNPIYRFYEKDLGKYLRSKFNAQTITDKQGVQWNEIDLTKIQKGPVTAFGKAQVKTLLTVGGVGVAAATGINKVNSIREKNKISIKSENNESQKTAIQEKKKEKTPTILDNSPIGVANKIIMTAVEEGFEDPEKLVRIAKAESSLNPKAKNPKSSATGVFQILDMHGLSKEDREDVVKATRWAIARIRKRGGYQDWKSSEDKWNKKK